MDSCPLPNSSQAPYSSALRLSSTNLKITSQPNLTLMASKIFTVSVASPNSTPSTASPSGQADESDNKESDKKDKSTRSWFRSYQGSPSNSTPHEINTPQESRKKFKKLPGKLNSGTGTIQVSVVSALAISRPTWIESLGGHEAVEKYGLSKMEIKRQQVIYEILITERDYVQDLELIVEVSSIFFLTTAFSLRNRKDSIGEVYELIFMKVSSQPRLSLNLSNRRATYILYEINNSPKRKILLFCFPTLNNSCQFIASF